VQLHLLLKMSSPNAAAVAQGKRRRLSAGRCTQLVESLAAQGLKKEQEEMLSYIIQALRDRPEMLVPVKALLDGGAGKEKPAQFARGVRFLTGPQTQSVPWYAVVHTLSSITGIDATVFDSMDNAKEEVKRIFAFAVGANDRHRLPETCVNIEKFIEWYGQMYRNNGMPLQHIKLGARLDWNHDLGYYRLVNNKGSILYTHVLYTPSGKLARLPAQLQVPVDQVPGQWSLEHNHIENACILQHTGGLSQSLAVLFPNVVGKTGLKVCEGVVECTGLHKRNCCCNCCVGYLIDVGWVVCG